MPVSGIAFAQFAAVRNGSNSPAAEFPAGLFEGAEPMSGFIRMAASAKVRALVSEYLRDG